MTFRKAATVSARTESMTPSATELAVIPSRPCSKARLRTRLRAPPLPTEYGANPMPTPGVPAAEEMAMIRPWPRSTIPGSTAWQQCRTPSRLTSIGPCQSSGTVSTKRFGSMSSAPPLPALATSTSTGPKSATAASTASRSVTSNGTAVA